MLRTGSRGLFCMDLRASYPLKKEFKIFYQCTYYQELNQAFKPGLPPFPILGEFYV
jgi:hypothetical protein